MSNEPDDEEYKEILKKASEIKSKQPALLTDKSKKEKDD
jgi:hypothetical protein